MRKKSVGRRAFLTISANSFSRQMAMPGFLLGISVSRLRKNVVCMTFRSSPLTLASSTTSGTPGFCRKP